MENHPIPQDVTGFQFKLIGNMTIKQFVYLATGIILAWVIFQLPIMLLIKVPLSSFFALLGVGLAFLPVGGRPMDVMIGNFIKALFRPTQFVYEKSGTPLYFSGKISAIKHLNENSALQKPSPAPVNTTIVHSSTPKAISNDSQQKPALPLQKPTGVREKPQEIKDQKEDSLKFTRVTGGAGGIPSIPDSPSIISGVAKGPRGNVLPNILIEVKDKEGNPVRAFKTNELGRFASATPLANGNYIIEFEDPKGVNKFETKTITVTGQIVPPIEAISIDPREELRRSLFFPDTSGIK